MRDSSRTRAFFIQSVTLLAFVLVVLGGGALAQPDVERLRYDPRAAHAEVDQNDDGQIDHEEFHLRLVEIFFHADRDKDGSLSFEELEAGIVFPEGARRADRNGDGQISLHEFVGQRFRDFAAVDTDGDNLLSVGEVVGAWQRGELK